MNADDKKDFTIKEYFEMNMHRELDDFVNITHFGQHPLAVNEFAKRHSDYIEQRRINERKEFDYDGKLKVFYPEFRRLIWECYCEYFEAFKYDTDGFTKWISRVNIELVRMPYPIQKDMAEQINEFHPDFSPEVNLVKPMQKIKE